MNIAICDDNEADLQAILCLVEQCCPVSYTTACFNHASTLMERLSAGGFREIQLIILDIKLADQNGIEIAKQIQNQYPLIKIIFVTGFLRYAEDIFEADPSYFLTKPLIPAKIEAALQKVNETLERQDMHRFVFENKTSIVNIPIANIQYLESTDKILTVHQANDPPISIRLSLGDAERQFPASFLRCHHSYLVNMDMIREFDATGIHLKSGEDIPVSRPKYAESKRRFKQYLGEAL